MNRIAVCRVSLLVSFLWGFAPTDRPSLNAQTDKPMLEAPTAQHGSVPRSEPVPAELAVTQFQLADGLEIELVAAEPDVIDPVAIRFDEQGRMWVVEMRDYPAGPAEGQPPRCQIKVLQDRDQNGTFEQVTVFADQLEFPTGLQPWKRGVIVTLAGEVAYLSDEDGDLRADRRETWYTGFAQENTQLRANHPTLGMDLRVHVANGLRGGKIRNHRLPDSADAELSLSGLDFSFDPLTGDCRVETGVGQFGLTFNARGERFVCSNRNPLKQIVIANRYLAGQQVATAIAAAHDVAAWGADSRLYPISQFWTTSNLHAGQFTAACGVLIFRGSGLRAIDQNSAFVCDPTGNLVHHELLVPQGPTYRAHPEEAGREFLATRDTWFRPVNLCEGPDGCLYLVDMYRAVIEHPQFMPTELKQRQDLLRGTQHGRIYRVRRRGSSPSVELANLQQSSRWVQALDSDNPWLRDTAMRLLFQQSDPGHRPELRALARKGQHPEARMSALRLLERHEPENSRLAIEASHDADPGVRRQAILVMESQLERAEVHDRLVELLADPSPTVAFQAALTLGLSPHRVPLASLEQLARRHAHSPWMRSALRLLVDDEAARILAGCLRDDSLDITQKQAVAQALFTAVSRSPQEAQQELLQSLLGDTELPLHLKYFALTSLCRSRKQAFNLLIDQLAKSPQDSTRADELLHQAQNELVQLLDGGAFAEQQQQAFDLVSQVRPLPQVVEELALRATHQPLRLQAIEQLIHVPQSTTWPILLERYAGLSPEVRRRLTDTALRNEALTRRFVEQIEQGTIRFSEIDTLAANRLLRHRDSDIRQRVGKLAAPPADRELALQQYRPSLELDGNAFRGQDIFRKHCATCHRIGNVGVDVAPDISDSRTRTPLQLLTDIVQPNRAIDANYLSYTVALADGRIISGILAEETAGTITLKQPEGKTETLLRDDVEAIQSTGMSLMPEGLERNLNQQAMADLIAFIKNWRYLDGQVPIDPRTGEPRKGASK